MDLCNYDSVYLSTYFTQLQCLLQGTHASLSLPSAPVRPSEAFPAVPALWCLAIHSHDEGTGAHATHLRPGVRPPKAYCWAGKESPLSRSTPTGSPEQGSGPRALADHLICPDFFGGQKVRWGIYRYTSDGAYTPLLGWLAGSPVVGVMCSCSLHAGQKLTSGTRGSRTECVPAHCRMQALRLALKGMLAHSPDDRPRGDP